MARAARRGPALIKNHDYSHIIRWYRETLPKVAPPPPARWEPIRIGPTWDWNPERGWLLPELSMGWEVLGWCGYWLRDQKGQDWQFTPEQARFLLHYEAISDAGRLLHRTAVFQRLKGHGKDPFACGFASAKAFGPTIFDHFDKNGDPVGREDPAAWVQIVAVSKEQTANTMKLFPIMLSQEVRRRYGIQIGRENVWGMGDTRQIQATSANFLAIEGKRVTLGIRNECQNWNASNQGHETAGAMNGNAAKIPDNLGRLLDIQNAFRPGQDSVAERVRDAWEATQDNEHRDATAIDFGLLYDSLEAPAEAPLTPAAVPEVIEAVRGDSVWLDPQTIVEDILNGANPPSESRRKWYNQITAAADSWVSPQEFDANFRDEEIAAGTSIVIFGDGSKTDDHTVLVGVRLDDGLAFPIGIWAPQVVKVGSRDVRVPIPRADVDQRFEEAMERWDVYGCWFDPSDARDAETGERYWEPTLDGWQQRHRHKLSRLPAAKTGARQHLVVWDMRDPRNLKTFTEATERALTDIRGEVDEDGKVIGPSPTPLFHNCPNPGQLKLGAAGLGVRMRGHVLNAKRRPNKFGVSIGKEHRESRKKVDAAVGMIGARMMWHYYAGQARKGREPGDGSVTTWNW
ncbi:terminase [Mycobacterium phage Nairb]|uniref:Terminase n=5 Tax=Bernalvirus bernal13 TaxID=1982102 RepID=A0A2P1JRN9_9CAUD|nr:terminase [Mycobacterium phage Bernal13]AIT13416.1 terminase [Mycobacterium phage RonRayGun]ASJ79084.1 terminase [Mycobacterium phage ZenTime222]AVO21791.1 terminase [Mycobacterium phage Nairb]QBP28848.1 terminase [Mycobacterium phage Ibrahim]QHB47409.1 terminase [Mycobacterium phage Whitty]